MPAKRNKKKSRLSFLNSTKARMVTVVLLFGLVGVGYLLYQTFAATEQIKYWGALTKESPTAAYTLTTGKGKMGVTFSNNTADVTLTVTNSAKKVVGTLKSKGKTDVSTTLNVTSDTYTISLKATQPFNSKQNKGYKIQVSYPTEELTKPTAVITKPLASESVSGIVDFSAQATDPKGIAKVEFYADGVLIGTDDTAPYSVKWDTTKLAAGVHTVSVKSFSTIGMFGEASGTVTVKKVANPTIPPNDKFGMSAPAEAWDQRLAEVGGKEHIKFRRIFYQGFDSNFKLVERSIQDGMVPIISFKVTPYSWRQVADGAADAAMRSMVAKLNAIPGEKFVALHHEPAKDGTAKDWSDMQVHALPIIKSAGTNIKVGVIGNGWWWSNQKNGYTDAEIATYVTKDVIAVSDVIAADTYQTDAGGEGPGPKIKNMGAWARRVGGVKALGVGEFNGIEANKITEGMNAVKSEPLVAWACLWNHDIGNFAKILSGDRLEAFKVGLATPNQT